MTLSSVAPTIDRNGISAPTLPELLQFLEDQYRDIYGSDVYLGPDSQDGQFLSILANALNDVNATAVAVYNSFSPSTAKGTGLSNVVQINGLQRHVSTYSTVDLNLTGVAGTIVHNGVVEDQNGHKWDLPSTVTLDSQGQVTATATCETIGNITALPNTVTKIQTPTRGWQAVTNATQASVGANTEQDGALRRRQAVSTALPSQAILDGIVGGVANVSGVTRYRIYENDTSSTDSNGLPAHSVSAVVEGGSDSNVADAIGKKKAPGTATYGNTTTHITDSAGIQKAIQFSRPTQATINIAVTLTALPGYLSTIGDSIKDALVDEINNQQIGATIYHGQLYGPANLQGGKNSDTFNITSLTLAQGSNTLSTSNIALSYNAIPVCTKSNITLTVN